MHTLLHEDTIRIIRFDKGDDVIALLSEYCLELGIHAGYFSAIGAASSITLAYYHLETKRYEDHVVTEDVEIANVTGNIALLDGKPVIHAHGVFGRKDLTAIGGHLKSLIVSATCEVTLITVSGTLKREKDDATGLNLLSE